MQVIGLMSGTSLDGVDLACVEFWEDHGRVCFNWIATQHIPYTHEWETKLVALTQSNAIQFTQTDYELGAYFGKLVADFINVYQLKPTLISSHGHTIFHQPSLGYTTQIGHGSKIYAATGVTTVCDFRSVDVALGGQGAPLVPIGDRDLFVGYDACINLGGFANISFDYSGKRIGFDIAPCNMGFNKLAQMLNSKFDKDGEIAAKGFFNEKLNVQLNNLDYFAQSGVKSLGIEWFNEYYWPIVISNELNIYDKMATINAQTAWQIARVIKLNRLKKVLFTGGGAFNKQLIKNVSAFTDAELIVADARLVTYKEALVFAYLGWLRINNKVNSLSSVTGAKNNNVGGAIYGPIL